MKTLLIAALLIGFTACQEKPDTKPPIYKDSDGDYLEFHCDKRCNDKNAVILTVTGFNISNGNPDLSKVEDFVFCCDDLTGLIDTLKKYDSLMPIFDKELKGKKIPYDDFGKIDPKYYRHILLGNDTVDVSTSTNWIYHNDSLFFKQIEVDIRKLNKGIAHAGFNNKPDLEKFIGFLEDNYKNCCL